MPTPTTRLGQRVEDVPNGDTTQELFYDPAGEFLGSYFNASSAPGWWYVAVPSLGRTLVQTEDWYIGQAWYLHYNALGSMLQFTTQTGANEGDIQTYPWGQTWQSTGPLSSGIYAGLSSFLCQVAPCPDQSKSRDYPSSFGRWMTPDPGGLKIVRPDDPQTWNMYAYVQNNPLTLNDPSGLQDPKIQAQSVCIASSNNTCPAASAPSSDKTESTPGSEEHRHRSIRDWKNSTDHGIRELYD